MKKNLLVAALLGGCLQASAQDVYQVENFISEDLNGTARYVGMGGAMSALGADLSVMGTNPAGIGLYRSSDVATSLSLRTMLDGKKFDGHSPTHVSFDNIGFVYSSKFSDTGTLRFFNMGFNYHKRKNFNQLLDVSQRNPGASQTWAMADMMLLWGENYAPPYAIAGYETYLINPTTDEYGEPVYDVYNSTQNRFRKASSGSMQEFDFNFSFNLEDRFYLGVTIGAYSVDMDSYSEYWEKLGTPEYDDGKYTMIDSRSLSGNGFDVKLGAIVRPFYDSPFRIGFSVASPTYLNLRADAYNAVYSDLAGHSSSYDYKHAIDGYTYQVETPWKFNVSLGHTIGNWLALGAEYEYADYTSAGVKYDDDWEWDYWYDSESTDHALERELRKQLKGVSTFKLGAEIRVVDGFSIRAGYNYVTSAFRKDAFLNHNINSVSIDYATSTDYMNLSDINRYTCGLGYRGNHLYVDFAYQLQKQKGTFYPYNTQQGDASNVNEALASNVKLDKQQLLLTLGYKF